MAHGAYLKSRFYHHPAVTVRVESLGLQVPPDVAAVLRLPTCGRRLAPTKLSQADRLFQPLVTARLWQTVFQAEGYNLFR